MKKNREAMAKKYREFRDNGVPKKPWLDQLKPAYETVVQAWHKGSDGRISPIPFRSWAGLGQSDVRSFEEFTNLLTEPGLPIIYVKEASWDGKFCARLMRPSEIFFLKEVLKEYQKATQQ